MFFALNPPNSKEFSCGYSVIQKSKKKLSRRCLPVYMQYSIDCWECKELILYHKTMLNGFVKMMYPK